MIEAGFPASNPKEAELFELLAGESFSHAEIAAFGMTRRRGVRGRRGRGAAAAGGLLRARLHARRQDLGPAPREGRAGRPRREPAHDRGVRRLPGRRGQDASSTTRSTSSTPGATTPPTRCACVRAAAEAGAALGDAVRHQRRVAAARGRGGHGGGRRARSTRAASASTATTTRSAAWPTRSPPCARAPGMVQGTMNGYGERCGNANLVSIVPNLQLKMGLDVPARPAGG